MQLISLPQTTFSLGVCALSLASAQNILLNAAPATPATTLPMPEQSNPSTLPFAVADEAAFFGALDLSKPELSAVKTAVQARDWGAAKTAWARHLETRTNPRWLWSRRDKAQIMRLLSEKDGGLARFVAPAEDALARRFTPQGVPYQLEKNINWQLKLSEETHVLSRFVYWRDMGLASWQTGDAKYAEDFVYVLRDWLSDNPIPRDLSKVHSPNTTWRTLEAGIRSASWWNTMELFMDAPQFDAQAKYEMSKSLMEHARYLYAWTDKYQGGNWQVIEANGLATTGLMFPEARESKSWRERGLMRLSEHMQRDILPDGAHSELTAGYHAVVMGSFSNISQLAKTNGTDVPGLLSRHEKMFDWLQETSQPNRTVPPTGDIHNLGQPIGSDMATGALLYNRPDFKFLAPPEAPASWVWTFGAGAFDRYAQIPSQRPGFNSYLTPDSKMFAMRSSWETDANYLMFDCAPWGGGHSHQDRLQIVVAAERNLLIDPGIYAYDQPLSTTYFRKSVAHNVVIIDGKEGHHGKDPKSNPQVLAWQTSPQTDFASGAIEEDGVRHQRSVLFVKPGIFIVVDHLSATTGKGTGEHEIKRLFHFAPTEITSEGNIARSAFASGTNLQIQVADDANLVMEKGWVTGGGAIAKEAPVATYVSKGTLPMTLVAVLTPFADAKTLPTIEKLTETNSRIARLRLVFADGQRDEIAVAPDAAALQIGAHQSQGRALVVRQGPQSNATLEIAAR